MKETLIEPLVTEFKDLKSQNKSMTIDSFVADVTENLSSRLYFDMFEAWLKTTTQRRVIDWIRKKCAQGRGGGYGTGSIDDTEGDFIKELISRLGPEGKVLFKEIIKAFDQLSEEEKPICLLYYVEGYNDREIGEIRGMQTNTVTQARRRAVQKVRAILRGWGYHV